MTDGIGGDDRRDDARFEDEMTALLSPAEAANRLHMSERTLRDLKRRGLIRYVALTEKMIRYRVQDCDDFVASVTVEPKLPGREVAARADVPKWPSVYFLRLGATGPIKIGMAKCLANRLHALRTGHPEVLILLAALRGGAKEEAAMHARFADDRIRGEWFEPSQNLLDFLEQIAGGDR